MSALRIIDTRVYVSIRRMRLPRARQNIVMREEERKGKRTECPTPSYRHP